MRRQNVPSQEDTVIGCRCARRLALGLMALGISPLLPADAEPADLAAARAVFERNLGAIRAHDRAAYLACYLDAGDHFARTGDEGLATGYAEFEKGAGAGFPDTFDASDLKLVALRSGVVYGTYRYRVRYGADEQTGVSERLFVETPAGWKITLTGAYLSRPGTPAPPRAFVGGTLVDGTGVAPVANATVLMRGGKIECAGLGCVVPKGVETVDAHGLWITPGIVDAHVHFSQTGWADGRPDALDVRDRYPYEKTSAELKAHPERLFRSQLCSGVTAVFDVGGYAWTVAMARATAGARAPHVAAAGPLLSTLDHWLNLPAERQFMLLKDAASARAGVSYLRSIGSDAVKVWFIVTPELPVDASAPAVMAAGEEARKAGLPLIVHATALAEAKAALRAGARLLVHGVSDLPVDEEFLTLAKKNDTIYCPTLTVLSGYLRMNRAAVSQSPPPVDDPNGCVDAGTLAKVAESARAGSAVRADRIASLEKRVADNDRVGLSNLKRVALAGIPVAMGTDAGNPLTLHGPSVYAEMEAMQAAGMSPMQVLVASTLGGARAMGGEKAFGTVEKGKDADLVVVAADPVSDIKNMRKLKWVVRAGVARSIEELRSVVAAGKW
jgi:imidazolonepropionase-like amidohydrolase